ncbi:MAG TPA: amidohydrolase, partial [Acidimicrobiia bacterium]|nr:amidohydrolase [Acidimicrobiia bacterium]
MDVNAPELDWLVSVDDHVIEPPNVWVDRAPAKYHDLVPRLIDDVWVYDGKRVGTSGLSVTIGKRKEEFTPNPVPYSEMPEAAYDPVARLV